MNGLDETLGLCLIFRYFHILLSYPVHADAVPQLLLVTYLNTISQTWIKRNIIRIKTSEHTKKQAEMLFNVKIMRVPAALIQTLSFSQIWMSSDYTGLSYGHSISRVRFSYAKLNKQLRGSEQFIKDSPESTPLTVFELKRAVNFHFKSSSFKDLWWNLI